MYPLDIPGISERLGSQFVFSDDANEQTIRRLVEEIPPQTRVGFYDKDYSSPSDPGAYVMFMRVKDQYIMQRANHGWSSKWKPTDSEKLVRYLSKCEKYNYGLSPFELMFVHYSVKPPDVKKWWQINK